MRSTYCFAGLCCLLLLLTPSLHAAAAARYPFRPGQHTAHQDLSEQVQPASDAFASVKRMPAAVRFEHHNAHALLHRKQARAKPPVEQSDVAHTDYICADSC